MERDCMICEETFIDNGDNDICDNCKENMEWATALSRERESKTTVDN